MDAVVEASRLLMAQVLLDERRRKRHRVSPEVADALQTLRDCLMAERRAR